MMNGTMSSSVNVIMSTNGGGGGGQTFGSLSSKNSERPLVGTVTGTGTSGSTVGGAGLNTASRQHLVPNRGFFDKHLGDTAAAQSQQQQQQQQHNQQQGGDSKITPRRGVNKSNLKVPDITDVRQMEKGLLQLLDDFHSGKLQAFGKDCSFEKMDSVREQQEKLARLHFDLCVQQDGYNNPLSEEGRMIAKENMAKLMENLQQLSLSIEQLHSSASNSGLQTEV